MSGRMTGQGDAQKSCGRRHNFETVDDRVGLARQHDLAPFTSISSHVEHQARAGLTFGQNGVDDPCFAVLHEIVEALIVEAMEKFFALPCNAVHEMRFSILACEL